MEFKIFLVFLFFLVVINANCPLSNNALSYNQFFNQNPQSRTLSSCPQWSNNTCCKNSYSNAVANRNDIISNSISSLITVTNGDVCDVALQDLRCLPCSPDQNIWFNYETYEVDLSLCQSFCTNLYNKCGSATLVSNSSKTVASSYSANEFCYRLLNPLFHVNIQSNSDTCFGNLRQCTQSDYIGVYSTCVNDVRNAYFFKDPNANCSGGYPQPNPVYGLVCDKTCGRGTYLPIGSTQCQDCQVGSFSLGGALAVYSWKVWPNINYKTYCTDFTGEIIEDLPGWVLNDTWVDSGDYLDDNQNSILEFEGKWVRNGTIKFNWRVSAEPNYDGLTFFIDGVQKIPLTSTHLSGYSTFNLTEGIHKFKFIYSKDYSVSVGDDRAYLYELIFEGVDYADSQCVLCPTGKFNNQTGQDSCTNCPFGSYNDEFGATTCKTCPQGTHAFEGSSSCIADLPCTASDYEMKTTECRTGVVMDRIYNWKSPKICDDSDFPLPPNQTGVPCFECQPGQYRPPNDPVCRPCPPGSYLTDSNTCVSCGAGSYAPRINTFSRWDTWPTGWNFTCDGDLCVTPPWRLNGQSVDSNIGHGAYSSPSVEIPLHIEGEDSRITISYRYICTSLCIAGFYTDTDLLGYRISATDVNLNTVSFKLLPGTKYFGIYFYRYDSGNYGTDRIIIRNITIYGDSSGGAISCLRCKNGTSSPGNSPFCSNCSVGSYSVNGDACAVCPANTFTPLNGSTSCKQCGVGTFSSPGSGECSTDCTYSPYATFRLGDNTLIKYNISALKKPTMWGPVIDSMNYKYYFSICSRHTDNTSCIDIDRRVIHSYACQNVGYYSQDLGSDLAFSLRPNAPADEGFVMSVTGGERAGCPKPRELNITFICDPTKYEGFPRPPSTGVVEIGTSCQYDVIWESLYACPVCSMRDVTFDVGVCINGYANKTYRWVESPNPKKCHSGISLPPTETVECGNLLCNPGQWQPPGSDKCVNTDPGYFSVGGASYYYDWTALPYEFTLACSSPKCTNWRLQDSVIASGSGDSSLFLELTYLVPGTISFTYRTNAEGASSLALYVDNNPVFTVNSTQIKYVQQVINVSAGKHVFRWKFTGGVISTIDSRPVFAKIKTIVAVGTKKSSGSQLPCLAGTYSAGGSSSCSICPANTFSSAVSSSCTPCLPDTYSIPQSSKCDDQPECKDSDYQQYFSPCNATTHTRVSYFTLSEPVICKRPIPHANLSLNCSLDSMNCPLGQIPSFSSDNSTLVCSPCPVGTYPDRDSFTCKPTPPGTFATSVSNSFSDNVLVTRPYLPDGYTSGCEGICGSNGWRVVNRNISGVFSPAVDSGYHGTNEIDSYMKYTGAFINDGSISFQFKVTGDDGVGLEFFIDGVMQPSVWRSNTKRDSFETVNFPVKKGNHTFMWLYHQAPGNTGLAVVQNLFMYGVNRGSFMTACPPGTFGAGPSQTSCAPCAPGSYNPDSSQTSCKYCPIGQFSWKEGSTDCLTCENGQNNQQAGMATCETSCLYTDPTSKLSFNITSLGTTTHGPITDVLTKKIYYINPCGSVDKCFNSNGIKINTYICEVDPVTGFGVSAGQSANFVPQVDSNNEVSLNVNYEDGDDAGCPPGQTITTEVVFVCDPTANQITYSGSLECKRAITWRSRASCRTCSTSNDPKTNPDYGVLYGECQQDNTRGVILYRNATCNGPSVILSSRISCVYDKGKKQIPVSAIIIVVVGVSILIGVIVVVAIKNRRLQHQYSSLLTQSINLDNDTELNKINNVDTESKSTTDEENN